MRIEWSARRAPVAALGLALACVGLGPALACGDDGGGAGGGGGSGGGSGGGGAGGGSGAGGAPANPERYCPGSVGCTAGADGTLRAGAAKVDLSPTGWERIRPDYLSDQGACDNGEPACGELVSVAFKDCGTDKLCPRDEGYTAPDADGTEADDVLDFFDDCGVDRLCPGDAGYVSPDADRSEGNGRYDGHWMAGFGNNRPIMGVHDPMWARAFAIANGDVTIVWVATDTVGFFQHNLDCPASEPKCAGQPGVRQRLAVLRPDLDLDYVIVSSTHQHGVPDTMGQWGFADEYGAAGVPTTRGVNDAWLLDVVVEGTARAAIEAVDALRPAKLYAGQAQTGTEGFQNDARDPYITDDTMTVLRFDDAASGDTIATVVNWANHPESMSDANNFSTSDFGYWMREGIESGLPAAGSHPALAGTGGICIWLQGTLGGLIKPLGLEVTARDGTLTGQRTWPKAQALGENLAEVALGALASATEVTEPAVSFAAEHVMLPIDNTFFKVAGITFDIFRRPFYDWDPNLPDSDENRPKGLSEIALVRVGDVSMVTIPGELFSELAVGFDDEWLHGHPWSRADNEDPADRTQVPDGPFLREMLGGRVQIMGGLALDQTGYIVPPYDWKVHEDAPYIEEAPGHHYEETNSAGPDQWPIISGVVRKLVEFSPAP